MSLMEELRRLEEREPMHPGGFLKFLIARGEASNCWDIPESFFMDYPSTDAPLPSQINICPEKFRRLLYGDGARAVIAEVQADLEDQLLD